MTTSTSPIAPTSPLGTPRLEEHLLLRSLTIVLPCFNEADSIADVLRNAASAAARTSRDYEIIVVDDGSADETAAVAGRFVTEDPRVRLLVHPHNRGYGDAVRTGIAAARMEWVLLTDSDGQFDLRELEDFVPLTPSSDVLWGRRVLRRDSLRRRASAAAWNRLVSGLFDLPVRDVDCAFKLVRRELLTRIELQTSGAMISTELAIRLRAQGARFAEIDVRHQPRLAGEETGGNPRVILRAFRELSAMHGPLRRLSRSAA